MAPTFEDGFEPLPPPPNTPNLRADAQAVEFDDTDYCIIGAMDLDENTLSSGILASRTVSEHWELDVANDIPKIFEAEMEILDTIALLNFIFLNGLLYQVRKLREQLADPLSLLTISILLILTLLGFNIRGVAQRSNSTRTRRIKHTLVLNTLLFFTTTSALALSGISLPAKYGALGDGSVSTGFIIHLVDHAMCSTGMCPLDNCLPPYFPDSIVLLSRHLLIWYVSFWLAIGSLKLGFGKVLLCVLQVLIDGLDTLKACFITVAEQIYNDIDTAFETLLVSRFLLPIALPLLACMVISYSVVAAMGLGLTISILDAVCVSTSATDKCRKVYAGLWNDGIWAVLGRVMDYSRKVLMPKDETEQSTKDTAMRWVRLQLVAIIMDGLVMSVGQQLEENLEEKWFGSA